MFHRPLTWLLLCALALSGCLGAPTPPAATPTIRPPNTALPSPVPSAQPPAKTDTARPPQATAGLSATVPPADTPTVVPMPSGPPNIILIVVDSLRADHLSSYGYARPTTPNLDALLAGQGVRFSDVTSAAPWTCPSNAALATGRTPTSLGASWLTIGASVPANAQTLAESLHDAGYYTAGFVNNACVRGRYGFAQGYDLYDDAFVDRPKSDAENKVRADEVNGKVTGWLTTDWPAANTGGRPLFLFVYYMEPHVFYDPPAPYDTLYDPDYTGPLTPASFGIGQDVVEGRFVPSPRDIDHLLALYDGEITFWDVYVGELLNELQQQGLLDNSLIVLTSDHGEMFGEHGKWVHGTALYEEEVRVPLVMRYPGRIAPGQVITTPVQSMDLMPTILEYAGAAVPANLQAAGLRGLIEGRGAPARRGVYSELDSIKDTSHWGYWLAPKTDLRSAREGQWKLIAHIGDQASDELYQVRPDTLAEGENLLAQQAAVAEQLRALLLAWFELMP
jgi:arylsulfatase A-like enzyme